MSQIPTPRITFIGGGNMASALVGGLLRDGLPPQAVTVVEPFEAQRERLAQQFPGTVLVAESASAPVAPDLVVWAVKPQTFAEAARAHGAHGREALHLSVAAGITSDSMVAWLGSERIVRAMPNTPALVGLGMTGLYARDGVTAADRERVEAVIRPTGDWVWVAQESQLDAVTALSGSGPAYVFYFLEAMRDAGVRMGLAPEVAHRLAVGTFVGAATLAQRSDDPPQTLRERVTSKGGTTHAALTHLESQGVKAHFEAALEAARARAQELGRAFGA